MMPICHEERLDGAHRLSHGFTRCLIRNQPKCVLNVLELDVHIGRPLGDAFRKFSNDACSSVREENGPGMRACSVHVSRAFIFFVLTRMFMLFDAIIVIIVHRREPH